MIALIGANMSSISNIVMYGVAHCDFMAAKWITTIKPSIGAISKSEKLLDPKPTKYSPTHPMYLIRIALIICYCCLIAHCKHLFNSCCLPFHHI